jgi:hypothetical protein
VNYAKTRGYGKTYQKSATIPSGMRARRKGHGSTSSTTSDQNHTVPAFSDRIQHSLPSQPDHSVIMQRKRSIHHHHNQCNTPSIRYRMNTTSSTKSITNPAQSSTAALQKAINENRQAQSFDPHSREVPSQCSMAPSARLW